MQQLIWWYMPISPVIGRLSKADRKFEATRSYTMSSRPARAVRAIQKDCFKTRAGRDTAQLGYIIRSCLKKKKQTKVKLNQPRPQHFQPPHTHTKKKGGLACSLEIGCLLSMHEVLGSIPNTTHGGREERREGEDK